MSTMQACDVHIQGTWQVLLAVRQLISRIHNLNNQGLHMMQYDSCTIAIDSNTKNKATVLHTNFALIKVWNKSWSASLVTQVLSLTFNLVLDTPPFLQAYALPYSHCLDSQCIKCSVSL